MYLPTGTPHAARAPRHRLPARHRRHQPAHLAHPARPGRATGAGRGRRRRPPPGRLPRPARPAGRRAGASGCAELADALARVDTAEVADAQTRTLPREAATPQLRGALVDRMALDDVTADTRLRRRPGKPCVLQPDGDRLHLLLGDRRRDGAGADHRRGRAGSARSTSSPRPTSALDPQSSLVLCRRLVREGLLEVVR